jgi:2'-5' RNA ligase
MRAFVALTLPDDALDRLEAVQAGLRVGRPVPRENLHLTLAFLDDQPVSVLQDLHAELADIHVPPFEITLTGLGAFGGERPRTLHAEAEDTPALTGLHRRVRSAARAAGIDLPRERFRPHVTLARFAPSEAANARAAIAWSVRTGAGLASVRFEVVDFALMSSQLGPDGPTYDLLARYELSFDIAPHEGAWAPEDH